LVAGLAVTFAVDATMRIAFLWYNLVGAAVCFGVGQAIAMTRPTAAR
jgi:hypothetical protein